MAVMMIVGGARIAWTEEVITSEVAVEDLVTEVEVLEVEEGVWPVEVIGELSKVILITQITQLIILRYGFVKSIAFHHFKS